MNRIHMNDGLMRGFEYNYVSLLLRNANPERGDPWEQMRKQFIRDVNDALFDALHELEVHRAEIEADAFPDRPAPFHNHPNYPPEVAEVIAAEIKRWLESHKMWWDCGLFVNGQEWRASSDGKTTIIERDPRDCLGEYAANDHIVSMWFEGPLYEVLNGYWPGWTKLEAEFSAILSAYGLYYEMGEAFNLSLYPM